MNIVTGLMIHIRIKIKKQEFGTYILYNNCVTTYYPYSCFVKWCGLLESCFNSNARYVCREKKTSFLLIMWKFECLLKKIFQNSYLCNKNDLVDMWIKHFVEIDQLSFLNVENVQTDICFFNFFEFREPQNIYVHYNTSLFRLTKAYTMVFKHHVCLCWIYEKYFHLTLLSTMFDMVVY